MAPILSPEGQLLVPIRPLFEQLGYQVDWLPTDNTILIRGETDVLRLIPGDSVAELNDRQITLGGPISIWRDHALMPLRQIAQSLGYSVAWNAALQQAVVKGR